MGILTNLILTGFVHRHNFRHNGISRRLLGFVPNEGNIIICGGDSSSNDSFACEIKEDCFFENIIQAAKNDKPAVCVYSDDSLTPEILTLLNDEEIKDRICFFGHTHSYIPFDKNIEPYKVEQMMGRVIDSYNRRYNSNDTSIQVTMAMLLNILDNCLPVEFFTYTNLANIISHLVKNDGSSYGGYNFLGEEEFLTWLKNETHSDLNFLENQLTINWNSAITTFFSFWKQLSSEVEGLQSKDLKKRSVYSCLLDRKVCILKVSSNYNQNLIELLFNELAFYKDIRRDYTFIDLNVDSCKLSNYQLLDAGRCVLIGNTLRSIGVKDYDPPRSYFVSLGITNSDATEIFKKLVATGWWTQVDLGFGHHSHVGFAPKHQEPITPDVLVNVTDGSAYIIGPNEYRSVDMFFV